MGSLLEVLFNIGLPLALFVIAYFIGASLEQNHFRKLRIREKASQSFLMVNFPYLPRDKTVVASELVTGSVVISIDHFKRFLASLRNLVGGRIKSYETLLDRARREAIMRLKENSRKGGYHAVINIRLETSRMASSGKKGKGTAGVEMLAFGTAIRFSR